MLYREIIAVCSQIHTKHIHTLCGQNVELLNVKPGGTYSGHWAIKSYEGLCSVDCSPCQHATRKPLLKWGEDSDAPTSQYRRVLRYLWIAQYCAALMVSSGIWCHEGVRRNSFKQGILNSTRQCRSVKLLANSNHE